MKIIKRDGSEVEFNEKKIVKAIKQANKSVAEAERLVESAVDFIAEDIKR